MKLLFYQTTFHDIELTEICQKVKHPLHRIAGTDIYSAVYECLKEKEKFGIDDKFISGKIRLSNWIENVLKNYDSSKILSVGCGTAIVESKLMENGYNVDLQECQNYSLKYFYNYGHPSILKKPNIIISQNLDCIPSVSHDCVISLTSSYPLNDEELESFFLSIKRILKKNGIFILYDNSYNFHYFLYSIYWKLRNIQHAGVQWGYKRTLNNWFGFAKRTGFLSEREAFFDIENNILPNYKIFGMPINPDIFWQAAVYRSI